MAFAECGGQAKIYVSENNVIKKYELDHEEEFKNELKFLSELDNEFVVTLIWNNINELKLILERAECDLESFLNKEYNALRVKPVKYLQQLVNGAIAIHSQNILHLDINPRNILVFSSNSNEFRLKYCDFGLSTRKDNPNSFDVNSPKGRVGYMTPEHMHGGTPDTLTDVWALGSTIWRIITGQEAFPFPTSSTIIYILGQKRHPYISKSWPNLIQKLLWKCWDNRSSSESLYDEFVNEDQNENANDFLTHKMPLKVEQKHIKSNQNRRLYCLMWSSDKAEILNNSCAAHYKHAKSLSVRKQAMAGKDPKFILKYLNENGTIKDESFLCKDTKKCRELLADIFGSTVHKRVFRTMGIADNKIDEIEKCKNIDSKIDEIIWCMQNKLKIQVTPDSLKRFSEDAGFYKE